MVKVLVALEVQLLDFLVKAVLELRTRHLVKVLLAAFMAAGEAGLMLVTILPYTETLEVMELLELFGVKTDRSHQQMQESYNGSLYTH